MSFTYKVGYGTAEESHYWEFAHVLCLDREAFMSAVKKCLLAVLRSEEIKRAQDRNISLEIVDLFEVDAFVREMKAAGFSPVRYEQSVSLDGWATVLAPRPDPHDDDESETRQVLEYLRAEVAE